MKLEDARQRVKQEVDGALREFFAKKRAEAARLLHPRGVPQAQHHPGGGVLALVDQVADLTMRGGKRIRPFLCWVGYSTVIASEARQSDILMHAMLGLELFQTFALIHDDIMDEDKERRGGKTIQEYFREFVIPAKAGIQKQKTGSPIRSGMTQHGQRFGESMAVLAGDLALTWADELVHPRGVPRSLHHPGGGDAWRLYQTMKEEVIYGQTLDISGGEKRKADELKTAYYSVVRPLQIGSSLAFKDSLLQRLSLNNTWQRYGLAVGRLFQLRDDVLDGELTEDVFAKEAKVLERQAHEALETLETRQEIKQLLIDVVQFVQKRKS